MKLKITTVAGGETLETSVGLPAAAADKDKPHILTNAVVQAASTAINTVSAAAAPLERLSIEVERG